MMISINSKTLRLGNLAKYSSTASTEPKNTDQAKPANSMSTNSILSMNNGKLAISPEAREKLALEEKALKEKITQKLKDSAMDNLHETKGDTDSDFLDKMIEQIQEQIKKVQRELRSLAKDGSKQSRYEQKMLESKLMNLNGTLISLFGKKLKALEEGTQ